MAGGPSLASSGAILIVAILAAFFYAAELPRAKVVLGFGRRQNRTVITNPNDFHAIPDTVHCEDLHYHEPSNLLFTACEDTEDTRYAWFPPLAHLDDPNVGLKAQGSIKIIDHGTMKAKKLKFTNFNGPFVTHGIDVIDDPDKPEGKAVYIFAVNHLPNPAYMDNSDANEPKARSIIEVFYHDIGDDTVEHIRSVWHPLITTPNDIVAMSPTSFFVTNDHFYRDGVMRDIENAFFGAKWSNTVYVEFAELADGSFRDSDRQVKASVALRGLHNNNGLGHGPTPSEIFVTSAASGRVHIGDIVSQENGDASPRITIKQSVDFDSLVDNPSWFRDPYANSTYDASRLVVPGLTRAVDLPKSQRGPRGADGVMVWTATPSRRDKTVGVGNKETWMKQLVFEDDSTRIRTASAAVLVAIDPAQENGQRKAWLFVTGFLSTSVGAVKIAL
ncbi:serum paraoxonase/arylesterase family protein [Metarhizium album ARSEF 1941]|uniref:Serum paraoxonase/arylesterase family protein n=1 Tax=Metarhizium album (strain ARSEF 1941) TaxID=1081103 RepID=A0A0B2WKS6_METAS|nr:serum paraoxonase/arylesterase family protein [Metarhizium album ARSEF 1941]KHN94092.1 serum paraoxonase/arylesterase family protein [Metarhizium album ARSEF 1941]